MTEPKLDQKQYANDESTLAERMAKGFAVDIAFGVLLLILSTLISDFSIAWLITMVSIAAFWGGWHFFRRRVQGTASEK